MEILEFKQPTGKAAVIDDAVEEPVAAKTTARARDRATSEAFGFLADAVVRDSEVSERLLVVLAYGVTHVGDWRTVVGDLTGEFPIVKPRTGLGRDNIEAALAEGRKLRLIDRGQSRPFEKATELHHLPPTDRHAVKIEQRMFVGALTLKATAALIFIRCGTGKGPHVFTRELEKRFSWSEKTALKVLRELQRHGLVFKHLFRDQRGLLNGVAYSTKAPETAPLSSTRKISGRDNSGHPKSGHRHKTPSHSPPHVTDLHFKPHRIVGPSAAASGTHDGSGKKTLDWKGLSNWTASRAVESFMALPTSSWFNPNVEFRSILTPTKWRAAVERFTDGPVPSHLLSSNALKQATEIALTLREGDENEAIKDLEAMLGIAWYIGQALNARREVKSLGFIALRLAHFVQQGDFSWARDFPMDLSEDAAEVARNWVEFGIEAFKRHGTEHDPEKLRASRRAQDLIYLVNKYGRDAVQGAIDSPIKGYVTTWGQLEASIKARVTEAGTSENRA